MASPRLFAALLLALAGCSGSRPPPESRRSAPEPPEALATADEASHQAVKTSEAAAGRWGAKSRVEGDDARGRPPSPTAPPPPGAERSPPADFGGLADQDAAKKRGPRDAPAPKVGGTGGASPDRGDRPREELARETPGERGAKPPPRAEPPPEPRAELPPPPPPGASGLKAGAADDNLAFGAFLGFLDENAHLGLRRDVSERVSVRVRDRDGLPLAGAKISVEEGGKARVERTSYADGRALIFPSESALLKRAGAVLKVEHGGRAASVPFDPRRRELEVQLDVSRPSWPAVPLDVAFVIDTTGSMGDEIHKLKETLDAIHFQIAHASPRPDVRFGMVLYRDRGDDYLTQKVPFTSSLETFRRALADVQAGGGGDYPEDVQEGLRVAIQELDWRPEGVRVAFLVGDAPPHLDYGQKYTYLDAAAEAARRGLKIAAIGASGLSREGEVVWRQIAQYTMAPFVFLTYGETGDSEGSPSSVSHHVGSNWVAEDLDAIIVRMVKVELSHYGTRAVTPPRDYFTAAHRPGSDGGRVLEELFQRSVKQLVDYSVERIGERTPTVVLPVRAGAFTEKLEARLALGLARSRHFQLLELAGKADLLSTLAAQLTLVHDDEKAVEVGKLVPARLAVLAKVEESAQRVEMLVKLVRLETGEVLSLSLLEIDRQLL